MRARKHVVNLTYVLNATLEKHIAPVFNIEVADNHNYFVGGDDGVLVHNCALQVEQFRKKYGIIKGVSDRKYMSNSFHVQVRDMFVAGDSIKEAN